MKETKIQVAAPSGGLYYGTDYNHTDWQRYSDSFKALGRPRVVHKHGTLRTRHLSPTIRGKWQIKAARKARRMK